MQTTLEENLNLNVIFARYRVNSSSYMIKNLSSK